MKEAVSGGFKLGEHFTSLYHFDASLIGLNEIVLKPKPLVRTQKPTLNNITTTSS